MMLALVRRATIACLMLMVPLATRGYAQETTGTIVGSVVDQTGAALPRVSVAITNVRTGEAHQLSTTDTGRFTIALPVGEYDVSFGRAGFQRSVVRKVSLHLNQRLQLNVQLQVGAAESVTVSAEQFLQPTSSVQRLIGSTEIQELPLVNRNFVHLAALGPGISSDLADEVEFCQNGFLNISINGARRSAVNWLLDGASNVHLLNGYNLLATPSMESIQEVNLVTSNYSAEWPRSGGGIVNVVTKSGASRFAGSAYEFFRTDELNSSSFLAVRSSASPAGSTAPPRLRYHNFGYTVGGPGLPSRKQLFFFFSEEWRRGSGPRRTAEWPVPDPAWLTDPRNPNYVPPAQRDPIAQKLLTLWPAPNVPGQNRFGQSIFNVTYPSTNNTRQEVVRVDYSFKPNWTVTGRYTHDLTIRTGGNPRLPSFQLEILRMPGTVGVTSIRGVIGRWSNELSYQFSAHQIAPKHPKGAIRTTKAALGVEIPELFAENAASLIPQIAVVGLPSVFGDPQPTTRRHRNHTVSDALTLQHRDHTFKAGGLLAFEGTDFNFIPEQTQGTFRFGPGGGFTAFQNFLRGNTNGACGAQCWYFESEVDVMNRFRFQRYEIYAQDTWRIRPRVTLDLGVRYALYPPVIDEGNNLFTFSPQAYDPARAPAFADPDGFFVLLGTGDLSNGLRLAGQNSPHGRAIYPLDKNNVQPRAGVSWDPWGDGKTIVRGGYGIYFDQWHVGPFVQNVQVSLFSPYDKGMFLVNPPLANPGAGTVITPSLFFAPFLSVFATGDPFVNPRRQQWNIGVQRRLYARGMADVGYIGSYGDHLLTFANINQPQPADVVSLEGAAHLARPFKGYSAIYMQQPTGRSRYHGLTASFRHDAGRSGFLSINYTLSRNNADATYGDFDDNPQNPLDPGAEFGPARTDRPHIFTATYVYELPFFRDSQNTALKAAFGGWQVAGITMVNSGPAVRMRAVRSGSSFPGLLRPNQVGDPSAGEQKGLFWFDPAAFEPPAEGAYGTAPVVPFRLPGRHQWDIAISKNLYLPGGRRLQVRSDLINAFNHTQFLDVDTFCAARTSCAEDRTFGQVISTRPPRQVQLAVKLYW